MSSFLYALKITEQFFNCIVIVKVAKFQIRTALFLIKNVLIILSLVKMIFKLILMLNVF